MSIHAKQSISNFNEKIKNEGQSFKSGISPGFEGDGCHIWLVYLTGSDPFQFDIKVTSLLQHNKQTFSIGYHTSTTINTTENTIFNR